MKTAEQLQAELDAANTQLQGLQAAEAQRAADARHANHVSFAEGLVSTARWPDAAKDVLVATLDHLTQPPGTQATGVVSFGEGGAAKPLATALQEQLQAMPASVSFGEFAKDGKAKTPANNHEVAARAVAHQERLQAAGQNISISQAIDAVNAGADKA
jgi:hypothetical protein